MRAALTACTPLTKRRYDNLSSDTRAPFWRRVSAFSDGAPRGGKAPTE